MGSRLARVSWLRVLAWVPRAGARAIAWFALLSLVLGALGLDPTWLWLSRDVARSPLHWPLLALFAVAVLVPVHRLAKEEVARKLDLASRGVVLIVGALSLRAAIGCWFAWAEGLHSMFPVPVSAIIALVLGAHAVGAPLPSTETASTPTWRVRALGAAGTAIAGVGLVGAQIGAVAFTDHRRPADAIVVLGARVYDSGRPSEALAQRMATACELYAAGYADKLVLSGGRGPTARVSEPQAMKRLALECGVPASAILLDEEGVDTRATAVNVARMLGEDARVLAVSHGYHLARVQIALEHHGVAAYTVPAHERILLPGKPYYVAREIVAWAVYLARG